MWTRRDRRWAGAAVVLLVAVIAGAQATCPGSPWQEWRGHCYRLSYQPVPWHGARGDCKAFFRAADVVSVTSKAENNFIKAALAGRQTVWLGMRSANDVLSWADGSPVRYKNFAPRRGRAKGAEDAVQLDGRTGQWQFAESHTEPPHHAVCRMPSCQCPAGWTEWDRRCYRAVRQPLSWLEARERCRRMADTADLVSIINARENNFVHEKEGAYVWSSGEKYPYTNWHKPSEPNGHNHSADCADMLVDKTWSDATCGASGPFKPFVCEMIICGRDEHIRPEPVKGRRFRVWRPEAETYGLRCPAGWSRSGSSCFSRPTEPDTFTGVQRLCTEAHPNAQVAVIGSLEDNDRAYYTAPSLPVWVDYGSRSGRSVNLAALARSSLQQAAQPVFTYWAPDAALARSVDSDCAALEETGQWRPKRCNRERLPGLCQLDACSPECPAGWIPFESRCYRTVRVRRTLQQAAAVCQRDGAHLASIQTQDENDFITNLAFKSKGVNYRADPDAKHVWIGAARPDRRTAWSWSDCDRWSLSRWRRADGDDLSLTSGTCATLFIDGRWQDYANCTHSKYNSVCELDPCREKFGPADKTGCRTAKVTTPETKPKPAEVPKTTRAPVTTKATTKAPVTTKATDAPTVPTTKPTEPPAPKEQFLCPADWTELDGYCYRGVIQQDTFVNAIQMCAVTFRPSHVASAHTEQQNQLILQLTGGGPSWLGLTSAYDFPAWRWLDGSNSEDFSAWARRQPDATAENMKVCSVVNRRGRWTARSCLEERHSFVCKLPAVRVVAEPSCPDPTRWREEGGSCYAFNHQEASFAESRRQCLSLSTAEFRVTLPVIKDAEEDAALLRLVNGHVMRLGLVRSRSGRWLWEDGSEPRYTNWLQPPPPPDQRPLCAVTDGRRGGWAVQDCDNTVPAYCEAVRVPDDYDYDYSEDYDYYE
ncbi:Macrophage mannose receptor 1 [Amphibalanus amphitrite]|uniref:Macrophage mannose receptor 1 n=1 Tax=Amphibalanus amphitrite TaxID=1232801 RepID=A0A6A4WKA4_AMPAM|nr:Macrophage mannose receptor 1 [Amphibalanus amphitrite]